MKLLEMFRKHEKMNLVHKNIFFSYLGFAAGEGVEITPPSS